MSTHDHPLDQRSLTLPDYRTALKRRFKRRKKPDLFWLLMSGYLIGDAAWSWFTGFHFHAILYTGISILFWTLAWNQDASPHWRKRVATTIIVLCLTAVASFMIR